MTDFVIEAAARQAEGRAPAVLHAACEVFADRGYRDATVAGICHKAGANPAAINYHFNDKESLYVEAWRQAAEEAERQMAAQGVWT